MLMALVMGAAEYFAKHRRETADLTLLDALSIGIAQVGALIPGVSRSGATFGAALALGFRVPATARTEGVFSRSVLPTLPWISFPAGSFASLTNRKRLDTRGR